MRTVALGNSSVRCSALGFGCVKLTTQKNRAEALRTLEAALDQGVTHFDVARLYGFGQAEGILGEFLHGKRDRVTVTSKFGLRPNQAIAKHRRLISIARQVLRRLPFIERRVKRLMARPPGSGLPAGIYTPQEAAESLDISLRELGTDYVDVFLLHEATPAEVSSELLDYLETEVQRGRIRCYGVGSSVAKLGDDLGAFSPGCRVFQFDNSALKPHLQRMQHTQGKGLITFGVMSPLGPLLEYARREPAQIRDLCEKAQLDLTSPEVLAELLLDHAASTNPGGVTLVATVNPRHVAANARAAEGNAFAEPQRRIFAELVRRVAATLPAEQATTTS